MVTIQGALCGERSGSTARLGPNAPESALTTGRGESVVLINSRPNDAHALAVSRWVSLGAKTVLWAGNSFPWIWIERLPHGEPDRIVCVSRIEWETLRRYNGFEKVGAAYLGGDRDLIDAAPPAARTAGPALSLSILRERKLTPPGTPRKDFTE